MDIKESLILFSGGNNDVVSDCYAKWKAELFLVAYHYFRNTHDADDILSECFAKLIELNPNKRKEKFIDNEINVKSLLLVMIKNRCLDEIKQRQNRKRIIGGIMHLFNHTSLK